MSGPFTEDVRGDVWRLFPRQSDDAAGKQCPVDERDDGEPDGGGSEAAEIRVNPKAEGDVFSSLSQSSS